MSDDLFDFAAGVTPPNDVAPKTGRKTRSDVGKKRGTRSSKSVSQIASGVEEIHTALGVMLAVVNQTDGELIVENAERAGKLWASAAQKNDAVRKALEKFLAASTFAEIIAFYMTIGVKIAVNHDLLPEKFSPIFAKDASTNGDGPQAGQGFAIPDLSEVPLETVQEMFPHLNISTREEVPGYTP